MANFSFLTTKKEYLMFAPACLEAEKVLHSSPAMCAIGCRKALELAVKWVYAADKTMALPYKDNIQALVHEPSFRFAVTPRTWSKLPYSRRAPPMPFHLQPSLYNKNPARENEHAHRKNREKQ